MIQTTEERNGIFFNGRKTPELTMLLHTLNEMSVAVCPRVMSKLP